MISTILSLVGLCRSKPVHDPLEESGYKDGMGGHHANPFPKKTPAYAAFEKGQKRAAREQAMYY